jgi:hypothetical protein
MVNAPVTRMVLAAALLSAATASNAGSIDFTLDVSTITSAAGGAATFFGTVTNDSGANLNASDFFFNFSGYDASSIAPSQDLAVVGPDFSIANGTTTSSVDLFSVSLAAIPTGTSFPFQVQLEDSLNDLGSVQTVTVNEIVNTTAAPEIDPSSATGALALLLGSLLVLRGRRKSESREYQPLT